MKKGWNTYALVKGVMCLCSNKTLRVLVLLLILMPVALSLFAAEQASITHSTSSSTATTVWLCTSCAAALIAIGAAVFIAMRMTAYKRHNASILHNAEQCEIDNSRILASLRASGIQAWRYESASRRFYNVWGMNEIDGYRIAEMRRLIVPEDFPAFLNYLDLIESGEEVQASVRVRRNGDNGELQEIEFDMVPVERNGSITDVVATIKDAPQATTAIMQEAQAQCEVANETSHAEPIHDTNEAIAPQQPVAQAEKEATSNVILDNMPPMIAYIDEQMNVAWENISRKAASSDMGFNLFATHDDAQKVIADAECMQLTANTIKQAKSYTCIKSIGDGKSVKITSTPIIGKDGNCRGAILHVTDISDMLGIQNALDKAESKVVETTNLLQHIIDNAPLSIFVKDAGNEHRYIWVNKIFCELMHQSSEEIIGHNDFELISNERAKKFYESDCEALRSPIPVLSTEAPSPEDDGTHYWRTQKTSFTMPDGRRIIVGLSSDISELQQTNIALVKAKERAEQSDRLKSAFLANMSHEIRTPLNAIVGFSQLLQETSDKEEMAEYIRIINDNNELLLRLINDILYLSKIDAGVAEIYTARTEITDMLDDITTIAAHNNPNSNVRIICDKRYRSCVCNIDRERIMQVWINFVTNAIKYTQEGYVKIGFDYRDGGLYIYVQDTGIGIAEEKQDRVFGRFEKLDNFAQGNGLGLSICKAIINQCQGKIGFTSKKFAGSTFYAWIPTTAEIELMPATEEPKLMAVEKPKELPKTDSMEERRLRVLVAEDNNNNYLLIKKILGFCNTFHATNGQECVNMVKQEKFDVVLMDIVMPVMDGLTATREIRKFNTTLPIIAVTANTFDTDSAKAIDAGCNEYLPKPINRPLLLNTLSKVVKL